ncbi:MAG: hypothetical protein U9N82_06065 [Thermodesulfobacteriota bacterium]|nr:hypothetical protein [Thermodesulfobacteriota bacterium]
MSPDNMKRMEELFAPHARKLAFYREKFCLSERKLCSDTMLEF